MWDISQPVRMEVSGVVGAWLETSMKGRRSELGEDLGYRG